MTVNEAMGGRTWTALIHHQIELRRAIALWMNSTLGLMIRTGYAQTTQPGRAVLRVRAIGDMPIPNFGAETDAGEWARLVADEHFERLAGLELEPASYAWRDVNRHKIDWVVLEMLGIDTPSARQAVTRIREMWCREPSVHGGNRKIVRALGLDA